MSRALRSGARRMFRSHGGAPGRWFNEQYRALTQRFGPFDAILRHYASGVCVLWVEFQRDTRALELAEQLRADGKGRRPSAQAIARMKKRKGLSWQTYDAALRRLEELAAKRATSPVADARARIAAKRTGSDG